jgi:hypothetical protein
MRANRRNHPPLEGEGRTAAGSPGWGDGDAASAEALSPPPGPLARADLPPAEPRYSEGSATQQSDRSRQQPTSVGGGEEATSFTPAGRTPSLPSGSGSGQRRGVIGVRSRLNGAANSSPPPCGEGLGVGVEPVGTPVPHGTTPHPDPPPQGGRESTRPNLTPVRVAPTAAHGLVFDHHNDRALLLRPALEIRLERYEETGCFTAGHHAMIEGERQREHATHRHLASVHRHA